jgi:hypothetical protein
MSKGGKRRPARTRLFVPFLVEMAAYSLLVTGYFFLVLHFLGGGLANLYETNKTTYALVTLSLIVGQGVLLETITTALLRIFQRWFHRG